MNNLLTAASIMLLSICPIVKASENTTAIIDKEISETQLKQPHAGDLITVKDLQKDLAQLKTLLDSTHPDPNFTMDLSDVKFQINKLSENITTPLTHLDAWKYLSQLNPYFQDGHMVISFPDSSKHLDNHIKNGGRLFPFKVQIDKSHRIYITDIQDTAKDIKIGDEITSINGVKASKVAQTILNRMHGDTDNHRLALASDRFSKMYWMLYGDTGHYQIEIQKNNEQHRYSVIGSNKNITISEPALSDLVERKVLENEIGYLRIDRFYYKPEHEKPFFKFMEETWQEFHDADVQDVIIDVRNNPGGTDHYWQIGIAPYVATEPFLFVSQFKMRLTERNLRLGPIKGELGSIVEAPFEHLVQVTGHEDLRIPGKAYLLAGPLSYSSTVLFLTAFQDAKQALIAGQESGARSCTTGRIQTLNLSGSKLELTLPTAIFTRPSGGDLCHDPIKLDLVVPGDPTDPSIAVNNLAKQIISNR